MSDWLNTEPAGEVFPAVLIADGDAADAADRLIAAAGGRVLATIRWGSVAGALGPQAGTPILVIEAAGVATDLLQRDLPDLAAMIRLLELHAIVALDDAQIDLVASALMGERVQLLCAPSEAERVAAFAVATRLSGGPVLRDRMSEGEAARLARLNEEVARIADVLARLSRRDDRGLTRGDVADRRPDFAGPPVEITIAASDVRQAIRARRLRDKPFGAGLFEDPAWDMLLDLFAAHLERAEVSVSSLCIAAAVAPTTALRWISRMTDAGLFERQPDPFDRRRAFMALSASALEKMRAYFAALRAQGLPVA